MALFLPRGLLPSLRGRLCKAGPPGGQPQLHGGLLLPAAAAAWRGLRGRQYSSSVTNHAGRRIVWSSYFGQIFNGRKYLNSEGLYNQVLVTGSEQGNTTPADNAWKESTEAVPGIQERTLIAVKPDGVQRRLIGDLISRFEKRGFKLVGMKLLQAPEGILADHYHDLRRKPFYPALIRYMSSGPVVAMVWEGYNVVRSSRAMVGETDSAEAKPGTIRGDFSVHISRNVIHASDSVEMAQKEISLWFRIDELVDWNLCDYSNLYQE